MGWELENQVPFDFFFGIFYILQVATTQKLQRFTVNGCVVICGVTAVLSFNVSKYCTNCLIWVPRFAEVA